MLCGLRTPVESYRPDSAAFLHWADCGTKHYYQKGELLDPWALEMDVNCHFGESNHSSGPCDPREVGKSVLDRLHYRDAANCPDTVLRTPEAHIPSGALGKLGKFVHSHYIENPADLGFGSENRSVVQDNAPQRFSEHIWNSNFGDKSENLLLGLALVRMSRDTLSNYSQCEPVAQYWHTKRNMGPV